jgi:hypothetical protein
MWNMHGVASSVSLSSCVWLCFTLCALLTHSLPWLHKISQHGKRSNTTTEKTASSSSSSSSRLQCFIDQLHDQLFIPKKLFLHLYVVGLGCAAYHTAHAWEEVTRTIPGPEFSGSGTGTGSGVGDESLVWCYTHRSQLCLILWTCHVLRRLFESLLITHYGSSRMHVGGYVAGMVHYVMVPVCLRETIGCTQSENSGDNNSSITALFMVAPCLLFVAANYYQFEAHLILYRMKDKQRRSANPSVYHLPTESWFSVVCVPHYSAEIVVYLSFVLLLPMNCHSPQLLLVWVTTNLAVVAQNQYTWYMHQYQSQVPHTWYKLIPYIW